MKFILLLLLPAISFGENYFSYLHKDVSGNPLIVILNDESPTPQTIVRYQENKFSKIPFIDSIKPLRIRTMFNAGNSTYVIAQFSHTMLEKPKVFSLTKNDWKEIGIIDCKAVNNYMIKNRTITYNCADSEKEIEQKSKVSIDLPDQELSFLSNKIKLNNEIWEISGGITYEWESLTIKKDKDTKSFTTSQIISEIK